MKRFILSLIIVCYLTIPCYAMEFTAPVVPDAGMRFMPDETESFGEGFCYVLKAAVEELHPAFTEAARICATLVVISILTSVCHGVVSSGKNAVSIAGTGTVAVLVLQSVNSMIRLGTQTAQEISQYGKLFLPVMGAALAAQGGITQSGALYSATVFFNAVLSNALTGLLTPLVYTFVCVCVTEKISEQDLLKQLKSTIKGMLTWGMKISLYVFTGYISITGVVSGTTDAAMLKATKISIASVVPVVGGIMSDASEAVLISAGIMKNAAGIYGLLAILAVGIGPFLHIGVQYLMLKVTSGICQTFGTSKIAELLKDFSDAMGIILAMIGTVCLILMISIICFMRGCG